ncbi:hypothetical protein U0070_014466 [Myodes glareolus]|uniref:EML-like second beta-propeller domain-containing protein n=1 Tax=Myodes glareolus TaxID=447135 RepID=A0AAW0J5L4_MYOGA
MADDSISAASTSDVQDRLSALESRVQQQEDEITVLKAALADVLRRLAISEDHVASVKKSVPNKEGEYIKMFMRGRPITMFIPSDVDNYDDIRTELPPEKLKLEWANLKSPELMQTGQQQSMSSVQVVWYGSSGPDWSGKMVSVSRLCPDPANLSVPIRVPGDKTLAIVVTFKRCQKLGLAVHPDKIRIATGQIAGVDKDGRDSGVHLCVIDDSNEHMLTVWDWQKKSKVAEIKTTNEVVLAVEFHPTDANTIITCGVYQISRQIKAHDGSVFTLCQMRNGMLLTGGGKDRKIILWDHDLNPEREIEVPDQYGTIRAVAEGKAEQFLVGTSRNFILRGTFNDGFQIEVQGHTDELWGLATHPFKDLLLTCAQDRQVCMWNSVEHRLEWTRLVDEPGHCADFHPSGTVVAIGTHSGRWFVLDAETRDLVSIHTDGNEQLSVMRYSVDGTLLAVGSHDNFIYLYSVSENARKYSRYGKCTSGCETRSCSKAQIVFSLPGDIENGCKLIRNRSDCKDIDWTTYTCVLGFQVFGVWPEGSDGTDINALVRSHNRRVIAVADDFCKVHLFQYPCSKAKAPSHKYSAHSSHVTNVSFTHNDSHLISTGGKDMSIIQWKLVEKLSLPQNEVITDSGPSKAPASSTENARQCNPPPLPPSQLLTETVEEERMSSSPTLVENSLEQTVDPNEEQSEGGSEDLGAVIDEEPASELSEKQGATDLPEDQQGAPPLC